MKYHSKGRRSIFLGCSSGRRRWSGWGNLEEWGSKFSSGWILANILSFLNGLLQGIVSPYKMSFVVLWMLLSSDCSAPLWLHMKRWSVWQLVIFSFLPSLLVSFPFTFSLSALGLHLPNKALVLNPCPGLCILGNWVSHTYFISDSHQYFETGRNVIISYILKMKLREAKWLVWDYFHSFSNHFLSTFYVLMVTDRQGSCFHGT